MAKIFYNAISVTSKGFEVVKIGTTLIIQGAAKRTDFGKTSGRTVKVEAVEVASKGLKVVQIGTTSGST